MKPGIKEARWGAIAAMIVGFVWGGWVTGGTDERMVATQSNIKVVEALVLRCPVRK